MSDLVEIGSAKVRKGSNESLSVGLIDIVKSKLNLTGEGDEQLTYSIASDIDGAVIITNTKHNQNDKAEN